MNKKQRKLFIKYVEEVNIELDILGTERIDLMMIGNNLIDLLKKINKVTK